MNKENEIQDAEIVETTDLQPVNKDIALRTHEEFSVAKAVAQWEQYQELTKKLLEPNDYQEIGSKIFKKKSAWRKYMRAFKLTEIEHSVKVPERDKRGWPIWAEAWSSVEGEGRIGTGYHECNIYERCCPAAEGMKCPKAGYESHQCCEKGCSGKIHWQHPGDIPATALTRAKNRAISDWVGAGEVSAEEITSEKKISKKKFLKCPVCGKDAVIEGKKEYGGGYVCWKKEGGCGEKWSDESFLKLSENKTTSTNLRDRYDTLRNEGLLMNMSIPKLPEQIPEKELISIGKALKKQIDTKKSELVKEYNRLKFELSTYGVPAAALIDITTKIPTQEIMKNLERIKKEVSEKEKDKEILDNMFDKEK